MSINTALYERDGITYYAILGENDVVRPARQCATCGGRPCMTVVANYDFGEFTHASYKLCCEECGAIGPTRIMRDEAVTSWNHKQFKKTRGISSSRIPLITGFSIAAILTAINVITCLYR